MRQKITSFAGGYVQPNSPSNLVLSEGVYSLSSRSNLPYVTFSGAGGFQKTISWGEFAEIPCGETVTVQNASAHPGNLFINSGIDPFTLPARITVPSPIETSGAEFGDSQTKYLFDVRRAKRAYLVIGGVVGAQPMTVTVIGRTQNSLDTENLILGPNVGAGYQQDHIINALTQIPPIPLGFKAVMGDDSRPMALLDSILVTFDVVLDPLPAAFFVAEYL
jgi:hypothetical protein